MSDPLRTYSPTPDAITVDRLSKRYRRPAPQEPGRSRFAWLRPGRTDGILIDVPIETDDEVEEEAEEEDEHFPADATEVWALREISFRIAEGSTVGLIGPNGAGKTTLIKVLARITVPTGGRALLRGRAAPLLAVASSLLEDNRTGRENVHLLARFFEAPAEVAEAQMDEILAFAELEEAADLPVSRYSTGLKQRLAFSIVLNLKPDILLADEILSVGDAAFKRRCLDRVAEAAQSGLTTLFASHDLGLVRRLCDRVIWLDSGRVVADGDAESVVAAYEREAAGRERAEAPVTASEEPEVEAPVATRPPRRGARPAFATEIRPSDEPSGGEVRSFNAHVAILLAQAAGADGTPREELPAGEPVRLELSLEVATPSVEVAGSFVLAREGRPHLRLVQPEGVLVQEPGFYVASVEVPPELLAPGAYQAKSGLWVVTRKGQESVLLRRRALVFRIAGEQLQQPSPAPAGERTDLPWTVERVTR